MHYSALVVAVAIFAPVASAAPFDAPHEIAGRDDSPPQCHTTLGGQYPAPYRTTWVTLAHPCTTTKTLTSTCTKTGPVVTVTATATASTTVTATTSTETDTETDTTTTTTVSTSVTTTTSTATRTTTATTTVPTSSGFVPIQSSLPGTSYSGSGGPDPVNKRDVDTRADASSRSPAQLPGQRLSKATYPKGVTCYKWCKDPCKSVTKRVTKTVTLHPSITVTSTKTLSSTLFPSATTTTTVTSTETSTSVVPSTATESSTATVTESTTVTLYAACASNNLADTYQSSILGNYYSDSSATLIQVSAASAYDCCVDSVVYGNAGAWGLFPGVQPYNCVFATYSSCSSQADHSYPALVGNQGYGQVSMGNGVCGEINYVG